MSILLTAKEMLSILISVSICDNISLANINKQHYVEPFSPDIFFFPILMLSSASRLHSNAISPLKNVFWPVRATYELEAAADGGLDVGAAEGGDLAELTGDLDGVVEEKAQAALVAEACRAGNLSEQDWGGQAGGRGRMESEAERRCTISKKQKGGRIMF